MLLMAATTASAQNSIDSVLQVIVGNNLELQALAADHQAAQLEMRGENAVKGLSVEYSPFYTQGYNGVASSELVVTQEFDFPTQYVSRSRQARLNGTALDAQYSVRRRKISIEAECLCYELIGENQRIDLLSERLSQSEKIADMLQKRMDAGDANVLELNKALLERTQTSQLLAEEENHRQELLLRLQVLNGNQPLTLSDKQLPEVEDLPAANYPTLLPEVQSAEDEVAALRHEERLTRQEWLPTLSVGYRRNTEEKEHLDGFLVGASFPLWGTSHKTKAARQRRESAQLRLEQTRTETEAAQKARYQQMVRLRSVLDHSDVALMRQTLPLLEKALQQGQINALQYYAEYNDLYEKLLYHITVHCQYLQLRAELYR